jgi:Holliday junction resolvase
VTTKSTARGTETETKVVRYLNENGFPVADRRRPNGRFDRGDITGIEGVCIEVKGDRSNKVSAWKAETVTEAANARAGMYLLVVRVDYKPVERWEAHLPWNLLGSPHMELGGELEDWQWVRMDLRLAVQMLRAMGYS